MDYLTFTTKLVDALAWPICVLIIAILFRNQLTDLFQRIVKGKIAGNEFEFSKTTLQELSNAEEQISPPPLDDDGNSDSSDPENNLDIAYQLLETSPRAAIINGWQHLYAKAVDTISSCVEDDSSSSSSDEDSSFREGPPKRNLPAARVTAYFRQYDILTADRIALFEELRRIRNKSVHEPGFGISELKAKEYLILTELLMEAL